MRILLTIAVLVMALPANAKDYLNCLDADETWRLRMGIEQEKIFYEFSQNGKVELRLDRAPDEVNARPWLGAGSTMFDEIDFENDGYVYTVNHSIERFPNPEDNDQIATSEFTGVLVSHKDSAEQIARFECEKFETALSVDFTYELMGEFGLCYDRSSGIWKNEDDQNCD